MSISGTINGTTESAAYTYDNLARLVTSSQTSNGSSAERRFVYDRYGNRTGVWDATSGGNEIQSVTLEQSGGAPTNRIASVSDEKGTANYSFDAAGSVTNDGVHSYGYDSVNRIVSVDGGSTASYAYDHQNRRYKKTIGSAVTHYVWEGSQVLAEHSGSTGAVLTDYIYSGRRMIAKVGSGATQYFLSDRLSTRLVLDTSGNVAGRQGHLAFGEDFAESGTQEKHHFTTYERDGESGMDYAINRRYSPTVGRFQSVDPRGASGTPAVAQTWNRYSYVQNDPENLVDPLGLEECALWGTYGVFQYYLMGDVIIRSEMISTYSVCLLGRAGVSKVGGGAGEGQGSGGAAGAARIVPLPGNLKDKLKALLEEGDCGTFASRLIDQAAKTTGRSSYSNDILTLFDKVTGPGGGGIVLSEGPLLVNGDRANGTVRGDIGNLGNSALTPPTVILNQLTAHSEFSYQQSLNYVYAYNTLHELVHLAGAGQYSDRELAQAVVDLGGLSEKEKKRFEKLQEGDIKGNSMFWDEFLKKHCP